MNHVFHRAPRVTLPHAVGGDGVYVIGEDGTRYLDACCGAAVSCLGHSDATVRQAMHAQIDKLAYVHSGFFTTDVMEELADRLIGLAPDGLERVYLLSGGSEAMEAAIKLTRQYFLEIDKPDRTRIIAREQSYHGNTLGALAVGGNKLRRSPFMPLLIDKVSHIPACNPYRLREDGESLEDYALRSANELETEILRLGPSTVAAFVAETVVGATAGALVPPPGYFKRIREICDQYGVLLILDEVMCGMGRTGTLFACEQEGISPDLLTTAKGLGAGYQAIGALLVSKEIFGTLVEGSGSFQHGHTYMGHATACAAACAVLDVIERDDLLANVRRQGETLTQLLHETFDNHPNVGDVRGRGLFQAIELVADRKTKEPFDPLMKVQARIKTQAMDRNMMCYPFGGTADGKRGDHVLLAPPFIVTDEQIHEIVRRLKEAVDAAVREVST
ncbi:aspartate aminotransferase family protein [Magnetospira sp. QH-2]|uniref:aspartate aminotransferase family protein n=1 Tax=Magnetospira sp. (strain QH-2) TaxID=1288970 RepID=UPI0003E80FC1|nr:aspartate aminotransferase family protein [Magnetospira sp. QH-2]CCQ73634.1 Putative adenosylmethionine--8-amino-7-oxononanoate transaminase [Magnetospira sp. QH-2]